MKYLVTRHPGRYDEKAEAVDEDKLMRILRNTFPPYGSLDNGDAIMIRRSDYLDTGTPDEVESRPKLTLIQGGKA